MSILRCNAVRNLGGTLNPKLFEYSQVGTKDLIHEYFTEVIKSLEYVSSSPNNKISLEKKLEFFTETRHAFGRTALLLSGGAGLGQYHFGVIKSLYDEGLLPRIIAGASIGSIFAAFLCLPLGVKYNWTEGIWGSGSKSGPLGAWGVGVQCMVKSNTF